MIVYVLTDGDYSDYHIIGVFSSETAAERAIKEFGGSLETYELDEIGKDNRITYSVTFYTNDPARVYAENKSQSTINEVRYNDTTWGKRYWEYMMSVLAEDKEHAIKIASDLVAQYKAIKQ